MEVHKWRKFPPAPTGISKVCQFLILAVAATSTCYAVLYGPSPKPLYVAFWGGCTMRWKNSILWAELFSWPLGPKPIMHKLSSHIILSQTLALWLARLNVDWSSLLTTKLVSELWLKAVHVPWHNRVSCYSSFYTDIWYIDSVFRRIAFWRKVHFESGAQHTGRNMPDKHNAFLRHPHRCFRCVFLYIIQI